MLFESLSTQELSFSLSRCSSLPPSSSFPFPQLITYALPIYKCYEKFSSNNTSLKIHNKRQISFVRFPSSYIPLRPIPIPSSWSLAPQANNKKRTTNKKSKLQIDTNRSFTRCQCEWQTEREREVVCVCEVFYCGLEHTGPPVHHLVAPLSKAAKGRSLSCPPGIIQLCLFHTSIS